MTGDAQSRRSTGTPQRGSTRNTALIAASPAAVYRAFTEPAALVAWLVPGEMTARLHRFDLRVGGGYEMSLYYPPAESAARGKSAEREDRYTARFVELQPPHRIVEAIGFDTADPAFSGEMTMEVSLAPADGGTSVTVGFTNLPPGVSPAENEAGTRSSLEKLARYLEQAPK